jgi:uncharacterized protein YybS (DUF2232 family)
LKLKTRGAATAVEGGCGICWKEPHPSLLLVGQRDCGIKSCSFEKSREKNFAPSILWRFCRFKNPEKLVWVLIASGFALLAKNDLVTRAALNVLIVAIALYFVQGMAVAVHFFKKFQVSRFVRFIFYGLSFLQPYLMVLVAAVGLFDLWCDFRTPKKQENL